MDRGWFIFCCRGSRCSGKEEGVGGCSGLGVYWVALGVYWLFGRYCCFGYI